MREDVDVTHFVVFCIEMYARAREMHGVDAAQKFEQYGVLDWLYEHYEVLHTQGWEFLLPEIEDFIREREVQ